MAAVEPSDLHRVYIQSLLSRRSMPEYIGAELYKRAVAACQSADETFRPIHSLTLSGFKAFLGEVGQLLEEVGLAVREGRDERKGTQWLALCNTDPSDVALQATDFSPLEITFIRGVVTDIVESYPENSIGHNRALSLVGKLEGTMTRSAAESILNALVSRGWLLKSRRGRYSLAPRAMLELEAYLRQEFEDIVRNCGRCNKLILTGVVCVNGDCDAHLHTYCYDQLQRQRPQCPKCKCSLTDNVPRPIGEKAARSETDDFTRDRGKRKRPSRTAQEDAEDSLEEEEGADPMEASSETVGNTQQSRAPRVSVRIGVTPVSSKLIMQATWATDSQSPRRSQSQSQRPRASAVPETQYAEDEDSAEEESPPRRRRR